MRRSINTVTLSPKFQVVIPREVREAMHLKSGIKLQVFCDAGRIWLAPVLPPRHIRGLIKGIASDVERDEDRV